MAEIDRRQGLEWYYTHKTVHNVIRNVRRRKGFTACATCGKEFECDGTPEKFCSAQCRYDGLRFARSKADAKRHGRPAPTQAPARKKNAAELLCNANLGKPVAKLAQETGLCTAAIYKYITRIKTDNPKLGVWALLGRMPDYALAKLAGVSHTTARKRRMAAGIPPYSKIRPHIDWSLWERALLDDAMTASGLAAIIGCDPSTVRERRRSLRGEGGKYANNHGGEND